MSRRKEDDPGQLWHLDFRKAGEPRPRQRTSPPGPPTGWTVLECLDDDRHMVNECIARALCDPQAKYVRVPVQLLARFSAVAADLSDHLWRNWPAELDLPLTKWSGQ